VESYNAAQVQKYEAGMSGAAKAGSLKVARALGASAKDASILERAFNNEVAVIASVLAFLEFFTSLVVLSLASRRQASARRPAPVGEFSEVEAAEEFNGHSSPKAHR
jgi:hypothetical protein